MSSGLSWSPQSGAASYSCRKRSSLPSIEAHASAKARMAGERSSGAGRRGKRSRFRSFRAHATYSIVATFRRDFRSSKFRSEVAFRVPKIDGLLHVEPERRSVPEERPEPGRHRRGNPLPTTKHSIERHSGDAEQAGDPRTDSLPVAGITISPRSAPGSEGSMLGVPLRDASGHGSPPSRCRWRPPRRRRRWSASRRTHPPRTVRLDHPFRAWKRRPGRFNTRGSRAASSAETE